jgi:hypothetical protein
MPDIRRPSNFGTKSPTLGIWNASRDADCRWYIGLWMAPKASNRHNFNNNLPCSFSTISGVIMHWKRVWSRPWWTPRHLIDVHNSTKRVKLCSYYATQPQNTRERLYSLVLQTSTFKLSIAIRGRQWGKNRSYQTDHLMVRLYGTS